MCSRARFRNWQVRQIIGTSTTSAVHSSWYLCKKNALVSKILPTVSLPPSWLTPWNNTRTVSPELHRFLILVSFCLIFLFLVQCGRWRWLSVSFYNQFVSYHMGLWPRLSSHKLSRDNSSVHSHAAVNARRAYRPWKRISRLACCSIYRQTGMQLITACGIWLSLDAWRHRVKRSHVTERSMTYIIYQLPDL